MVCQVVGRSQHRRHLAAPGPSRCLGGTAAFFFGFGILQWPRNVSQNPKSSGVRPDWRMMERVVPIGSTFLGCGTMAMRPAAFLYLAWLPFWVAKEKPCCWSTRMTSEEPSRLGIHQFLPKRDFTDRGIGVAGLALEIELHRLFQIGHGLIPSSAEAGYVHVETLGDDELILPVEDVRDCLHRVKNTMPVGAGQPRNQSQG